NFRKLENFSANITITDNDNELSSYIFSTNNTGSWVNDSLVTISGSIYSANTTKNISLGQSNYVCWKYYANDTSNSVQVSSEYCFTVVNTIPAVPTVYYPVNSKNYSNIPYINYSSSDVDNDTITYNVYINGRLNISSSSNVTDWNASDGYYNLTVSASDSGGSSANSSRVIFRLDSTAPSWSGNKTNYNSSMEYDSERVYQFNIAVNDSNIDSVSIEHNFTGSFANYSVNNLNNEYYYDYTGIVAGTYVYKWYMNDTAGNSNITDQWIFVVTSDISSPNITLSSPANSSTWTSSSTVTFSYIVTDNGNVTNCSLLIGGSIDQTDTTITKGTQQSFTKTLSNSEYNWSIRCNDTAGNLGNSSVYYLTVSYSASPGQHSSPGGGGGGGGGAVVPKSIEEVVSETFYECSEDSDCALNQYCFEHECYNAECFDDNDCKEDESCWNYRCIKWFDMEILEFESPVKIGNFFNFTYLVKGMAEIKGDVEIKFWIEQDGNVVTSGKDTIYLGSFEEKTKTKELFLPEDISSGTYAFYTEVTYGTYTASAHRTIGIVIDGDLARITPSPKVDKPAPKVEYLTYLIDSLIGLVLFALFLILYFKIRKIKTGLVKERKQKIRTNERLKHVSGKRKEGGKIKKQIENAKRDIAEKIRKIQEKRTLKEKEKREAKTRPINEIIKKMSSLVESDNKEEAKPLYKELQVEYKKLPKELKSKFFKKCMELKDKIRG
ncbi:MAG: hypothetical protein U9O94_04975, partial [Nanoarchaeota archaeon]|nr:hypothetical protein [Nanoarchaeota archaeon]